MGEGPSGSPPPQGADSGGSASRSRVKMVCAGMRYDPQKYKELWHSSSPFVMETYRRKLKRCSGCNAEFARPGKPVSKFVIAHEERREFWRDRARNMSSQKAFYHCSASCISPRHPYFKPSEVTAAPEVAIALSWEDVRLMKQYGIDLAFVRA